MRTKRTQLRHIKWKVSCHCLLVIPQELLYLQKYIDIFFNKFQPPIKCTAKTFGSKLCQKLMDGYEEVVGTLRLLRLRDENLEENLRCSVGDKQRQSLVCVYKFKENKQPLTTTTTNTNAKQQPAFHLLHCQIFWEEKLLFCIIGHN